MARIAKWMPVAALVALVAAPYGVGGQVFQPEDLSELPALRSADQAQRIILRSYPRALQDAAIGGKVQVRFIVTAEGTVDGNTVEVLAASVKALGEAAQKAVADIEFKPGKKDGQPVASVVVMPVTYGVS